jgi:hypothetical protein
LEERREKKSHVGIKIGFENELTQKKNLAFRTLSLLKELLISNFHIDFN